MKPGGQTGSWFGLVILALMPAWPAWGSPPDLPFNISPPDGAVEVQANPMICARVTDPDGEPMVVNMLGRELSGDLAPDLSVIVLPDTQVYSRLYPQIFDAQSRWIVEARETRNIAFVTHVGDCVDNATIAFEWTVANASLSLLEDPLTTLLEDGIPYGIAVGNHDHDGSPGTLDDDGSTSVLYNQFFGVSRFENREYYGGHFGSSNDNHFELFSASGIDFITLHLEYDEDALDGGELRSAVLEWADGLLKEHADRWAIVTSHYLLEPTGEFGDQGQAIYDALKDNPNLALMFCGHLWENPHRSDTHEGNTVHTLMSNYQSLPEGGAGWLRIVTLSPQSNEIFVETYSPWLDEFKTVPADQFTLPHDMDDGLPFEAIGPPVQAASGAVICVPWPGRREGSSYQWYVTSTDAESTTTGARWSFIADGACDDNDDCGDGDPCSDDTCQSNRCVTVQIPNCCVSNTDCADGNPCTDEACDAGTCAITLNTDPCSDGDGCTLDDTCLDGNCSGAQLDCDDFIPCTIDSCLDGKCLHDYAPTAGCCAGDFFCDDGNPCTVDVCGLGGDCTNVPDPECCSLPEQCDDGDECTVNICSSNRAGLFLNGQGAHISMGYAPGLNAREFTIECWFKWDGSGLPTTTSDGGPGDTGGLTVYPLVTKGRVQSDNDPDKHINYFLGIEVESEVIAADFEEHSSGSNPGLNHPVIGTTPVSPDVWHHAAVTYDGCCWQLFLDGNPETDGNNCPGEPTNFDNGSHFAAGTAIATTNALSGGFGGHLDEVRVWNRALDEIEIRSFLESPIETHPDLLGRWGFDEGSGYYAADSVAEGHDGVVVLAGWETDDLPPLGTERCSFPPVTECCQHAGECEDSNDCTIDTCDEGGCEHAYVPTEGCCTADSHCDDRDPCTADLCADTFICSNRPLDMDLDGQPDCVDLDQDGDDVPDCQDCAPRDPAHWAPPAAVTGVRVDGFLPAIVSWDQGNPGLVYDVASGLLSLLNEQRGASDASCLLDNGQLPSHTDSRPGPPPGEGFFYLIRAEGVCVGSYGTSSSGEERLPAGPCP